MLAFRVVVVGLLILSAGCVGVGDGQDRSRLDLAVQNDREQPLPFQLTLSEADGTVLVNESDRIDGGVGRAFDFTVGTSGRHEVTVSGEDWRGQLAWNADTCARFEATVRITEDDVDVAGECVSRQS